MELMQAIGLGLVAALVAGLVGVTVMVALDLAEQREWGRLVVAVVLTLLLMLLVELASLRGALLPVPGYWVIVVGMMLLASAGLLIRRHLAALVIVRLLLAVPGGRVAWLSLFASAKANAIPVPLCHAALKALKQVGVVRFDDGGAIAGRWVVLQGWRKPDGVAGREEPYDERKAGLV